MTKQELVRRVVDMNEAEDLAIWILELTVGKNYEEEGFEDNEEFRTLAKDYEDSDED